MAALSHEEQRLLYQLPLVMAPNIIFSGPCIIILILGSGSEYKNYSACAPSLAYMVWFSVLIPYCTNYPANNKQPQVDRPCFSC
jgi:hypothetical protein